MRLSISLFTLILGLGLVFVPVSFGASYEEQVRERLQPIGKVCIMGKESDYCRRASVPPAPAGPRTAKAIYDQYCFSCHGTGAGGAPKLGDDAAWQPRLAQGMDTLVRNAINGINNGLMPARGLCNDCSDEEIRDTVTYILENGDI